MYLGKIKKMKMYSVKLVVFVFLMSLLSVFVNAQSSNIVISYSDSLLLVVNDIPLDSNSTLELLIKTLGEPSRNVVSRSGEVSYYYDKVGVVFVVKDGVFKLLGVNFLWDGDDHFPETSYTGSLFIGEKEINAETLSADIVSIETIEFICPIPSMCVVNKRSADIRCMSGFKDKQLTQFIFLVK